jgi:hypothetical protein
MEVLYPRCAGLDVHQDTVVAALRCMSEPRHHEVRRFATTTNGLLALADWLTAHGCTHVAMEAAGVYWKPIWHVLEADLRVGARQRAAHPQHPRAHDGVRHRLARHPSQLSPHS